MLKTYTIATGNSDTTQAAADILDRGGNAYDAVLAALFMSFVSEPLLSSPGGGGYLLARPKGEHPKIFDFFAQTPLNKHLKNRDFYPINGDFGVTQQEFHIGMAAAAVPGVPAGIFAIHNHYGNLDLLEIADAAIEKAKKGMQVDKPHAEVINILSPILNHSCYAKAIFSNAQEQLLQQGETKKNPHLASFLNELATQSMDWFYYDTPATNIATDMQHNHGLLRQVDFESYQVQIRAPLVDEINGWKIITNSAPTTGGFLILQQLKHALNNQSKNPYEKTIDAMLFADKLKNQQSFQSSKGTTHMSVIDGEGNIDSGGFFKFTENTRMASMMSPSIIEKGTDKIALGTGGSNRIKTAMFQVIWHIIVENKTLSQAINLSRLHFENGLLEIEKGFNQQAIENIKHQYKNTSEWQKRSLYFGGVNATQQGTSNVAIGDSRRSAVGLVKIINK